MTPPRPIEAEPRAAGQGWSLLLALCMMFGGTLYPLALTGADGRVDHGFAALFWGCMSIAFVHGVGFVPRHPWGRWACSGWAVACTALVLLLWKWRMAG